MSNEINDVYTKIILRHASDEVWKTDIEKDFKKNVHFWELDKLLEFNDKGGFCIMMGLGTMSMPIRQRLPYDLMRADNN